MTFWKVFWEFLWLGCVSFGGPAAHVGYFHRRFVVRLAWLDEAAFARLLALTQFLPGPASSQLGFAIGRHRSGLAGGVAAFLGFTLPSFLIMVMVALYATRLPETWLNGLVTGLKWLAVVVVADAVLTLGGKFCRDRFTRGLALATALALWLFPGVGVQLLALVLAALIGRRRLKPSPTPPQADTADGRVAWLPLGLFAAAWILLWLIGGGTLGGLARDFYSAGALVFGGGHVVLPLLHDSVVPSGLVSESNFLAGYSAAQALPGPLFTLSAFLGTASQSTSPQWIGGIIALVAIFLPGMLLLVGLLPLWNTFRNKVWAQAGLIGANAAVVGLLLAALINPVWAHGIQRWPDAVLAAGAFVALSRFKVPAWLVVFICGACGFLIQ